MNRVEETFAPTLHRLFKKEREELNRLRLVYKADEKSARICGCNSCRLTADRSLRILSVEEYRILGQHQPDQEEERLTNIALSRLHIDPEEGDTKP